MTGYVTPRTGGPHQPRRTPMRLADGVGIPVVGGVPDAPRRRRVIPQPFQRPSTELSPPPHLRRVWRYVTAEEVQIGDTVPELGVVLDCLGRPEVGCPWHRPRSEEPELVDLCQLEEGHSGAHEYSRAVAEAAGVRCVPGMYWTLVGPEIFKEFAPHEVVLAFQLEEGL